MMKKIQDAGFRIVEVPVHHYHRAFGKSQFFNFRRLFQTGIDVLRPLVRAGRPAPASRAGLTPLAKTAIDPGNRVYPGPPRP